MKLALFIVVLIGIAIGCSIPMAAPHPATPAATAAPAPVETVLDRGPGGHFFAGADVNGATIRFLVDTGATDVALTEDDARRAHVDFDPADYRVIGRGASGDVRGQQVWIKDIELDGKRATGVRGVVIEGGDISLLGQAFLSTIETVQIKGDQMTLR